MSKFYDLKTGFTGFPKYWERVKGTMSYKEAKQFYDSQEVNQIRKPLKTNIEYKHIIDQSDTYQIDIMHFDDIFKPNKWLVLIEINSRWAWMTPLTNRDNKTIINALNTFPDKIVKLYSDDEFNTKQINDYCMKNDILLFSVVAEDVHITNTGNPLGIVDRFTKTIKGMLGKYYEYTGDRFIKEVIPQLLDNYNSSKNKGTGYAPDDVRKRPQLNTITNVGIDTPELEVGDRVRIPVRRSKFAKEGAIWSKQVFDIEGKRFNKYLVNGKEYSYNQLQKVGRVQAIPDEVHEGIERVHKEKVVSRKLRDAGVESANIVSGKRERRKKVVFDA